MTAELKILFHATFREITRTREITKIIQEGCTVSFILEKLAEDYGKDFREIIEPETGEITTDVLIMLNGRGIRKPDIKLKDKDVLVITLPLGGG